VAARRTDDASRTRPPQDVPGGEAEKPTEIPAKGWKQVLIRAWKETKNDHIPLLAAGVAYYAFLAIFPALIAAVSIFGLVADPAQIQSQIEQYVGALPGAARDVITTQLRDVAETGSGALSIGLAASVLGALWAASGGVTGLMKAVNVAYDEDETRGFLKMRGLALLLTLGAIVFVLVALTLVAVMPAVLGQLGLGTVGQVLAQTVRWGLLVAVVVVALAIVYRVAPDRDAPKFRWVSLGAVVATVLWVLGSVGFSLYVNNFSSYNETYGIFAGVAILLLWLFVTSFIVLLGAEINAESEFQTARDSTKGEEQPMGQRRADKADAYPDR
jgi:membrane protein